MGPAKETVKTTCPYCGVGCGVRVLRDARGTLSVDGDETSPVNQGRLCSKGRYLHHTVTDRHKRLLHPMMRKAPGQPLVRVSWDTAMARAAAVFKTFIARFGPESVAFYVSGQFLTEEYYLANKLMKGFIGSNNIDTNSRLCMSSAVVGYKMALGDDLCPISYSDIELGDTFLIAGANPAWCHPILYRRLEQHVGRNREARVIVVDPRRTPTCALASLHLQIRPGTDVALYNAIAAELIRQGHIDTQFVESHTAGFEALRDALAGCTIAAAALECDVPAEAIAEAAAIIGHAKAFQTWWAMGLNQSVHGVDKNLALLNLSLLTGQIGKPGAGPFSLTGQPNAMGGREVGGMATLLAAHRDLANPEHRRLVQEYWGSGPISAKPGLTACEMVDALETGELRALWVMCTNPAVSLPRLRKAEAAFAKAKFLIVQDVSSESDTLAYADLVLPAAGWLEKRGTMTNSERRVSLLPKLLDAPGEARPDVEILCDFARRMGWGDAFTYADEEAIFNEHRALTRGTAVDMGGISYARLEREGGIQWPCPEETHPGTERLFAEGRFATPDGRARLHAVAYTASTPTTAERPFVLLTGRIRDQWHTMTRTGLVKKLRQHIDAPYVEVHPEDAAALLIADGDTVRVANEFGEALLGAKVTSDIRRGALFMPMHWGKRFNGGSGRANNLSSGQLDRQSGEPDFKYITVSLASVRHTPRRIAVVGAGAAALRFVQAYRARNHEDEIEVFGNENEPFYNRVELPHYIDGSRGWEDLITCGTPELEQLGVIYRRNAPIIEIRPAERRIVDVHGRTHGYDKLILATGSRPVTPPGLQTALEGVFILRSRSDADAIRSWLAPGGAAVVVGAGLLGIELVGALLELGIACTLVHRSPRIMRAQLDAVASSLLQQELRDRGVRVMLNDQVARISGEARIESVRTESGHFVPCDALFLAVGTQPNKEIAEAAGLRCGRGVLVDAHLRTSDPDVHAIGEVAEFEERLYGTTPAAQKQAETAAAALLGDPAARYAGSLAYNVLKFPGLRLCSIGAATLGADADDVEEVVLSDPAQRYYKKCVVRRNRLAGALLYGDISEAGDFRQLIESGTELDERRRELLRSAAGTRPAPKGRLVCSCFQVGSENIADAVRAGCQDVASVGRETCAGTGCGSCQPEIEALCARLPKAMGMAVHA